MTSIPLSRRCLPWAGAILLSVAAAFGVIEAVRLSLEHAYHNELGTEVERRAFEVTAQTMKGNVMGSVATLGLVNDPIRRVAQGKAPIQDPVVLETLRAAGQAYGANGMFIVNAAGIIQSAWYNAGVSLTGENVAFRPYFKIAMKGEPNVYAAVGSTTGLRSLYFAAPLHADGSYTSPVIGATVARLDLDRVDSLLKTWSGPALLLSPEGVTFSANRTQWISRMAEAPTSEQVKALQRRKQFGTFIDSILPETLPFDVASGTATLDRRRYAIARAPVQWNDPGGQWNLVLLGDLDALMPASRRAELGASSGALVLAVSALFLVWRRRLRHAQEEHRREAAALAALDERSRLILGAVGDGIVGMDPEGNITFVNPAVPAMLGYAEADLIGRPMHALVHAHYPDGRDFPREECSMYLTSRDGVARRVDSEVLWRKDGGALPVEYSTTPVFKDGAIIGSVIVFSDITARREAEAALRTNQQQIRTLVDSIQSVIFMKDVQGRHLLVNAFHEQATGIPAADTIGKTDSELLPRDVAERKAAQDRLVLESRRTASFEEVVPGPDGKDRHYLTTKVPLCDDQGNVYGLCGSAMDITEQKLGMEELERFNRLTLNREEKMIQLKGEINILLEQTGQEKRYKIVQ